MNALIAIFLLFFVCELNRDEDMNIRTSRIQQQIHEAHLDVSNRELHCMTENIIYEAAGEGVAGQIAVAQVTMNRVNHIKYPKTICDVVNQPNQFSWVGQANKRKYGTIEYSQTKIIALNVISKRVMIRELKEATHYHAVYVKPHWSKKFKKLLRLNNHIFYKEVAWNSKSQKIPTR